MQPDVDQLIAFLINAALESVIAERCTANEASDVRFALSNPEPQLTDKVELLHGAIVNTLAAGVAPILNTALYGE